MTAGLCLIACECLRNEILNFLTYPNMDSVRAEWVPAGCQNATVTRESVAKLLELHGTDNAVVIGSTSSLCSGDDKSCSRCCFDCRLSCLSMFVDEQEIERLSGSGAWITIPGIIKRWNLPDFRTGMAETNLEKLTSGHTEAVILQICEDPDLPDVLRAFQAATGLPTRTVKLSPGRFNHAVGSTILACLLQKDTEGRSRLEREKQLLDSLINGMTDLVFFKDRDGRYLLFNRALKEVAGAFGDEVKGRTDFDFFTRDRANRLRSADLEVLDSGVPSTTDEVLILGDGTPRYFETVRIPVISPDDATQGILGVARDVTARKLSERAVGERNLEISCLYSMVSRLADPSADADFIARSAVELIPSAWINPSTIGVRAEVGGMVRQNPDFDDDAISVAAQISFGEKVYGSLTISCNTCDDWERRDFENRKGPEIANAVASQVGQACSRLDAVRSLQDSEHRHRLITEYSPVGLMRIDRHGTIVDSNKAAADIFGSSVDRLNGFNSIDQVTDLNMLSTIRKCLAGERAVFEGPYTSITGGICREIRLTATPVAGPDAYHECIAAVEDLTESKAAETEILSSRAQLAEAQRIARIGSFNYDAGTGITTASDECVRIFGLDPRDGQFRVDDFIGTFREDFRNEIIRRIKDLSTPGNNRPSPLRTCLVMGDGTERWVDLQAEIETDDLGIPRRVFGVVHDVTQSHVTEIRLREAKERLDQATDQIEMAIWEWRAPGIVTVDDRYEDIVGISRDNPDIMGVWSGIVNEQDSGRVWAVFQDAITGKADSFDFEFRISHPRKGPIWVHSRGRVLDRDESGQPVRILGSTMDITSRKSLEKRLEESVSLLTATMESTVDAILAEDLNGIPRLHNSRFLQMWGITDTDPTTVVLRNQVAARMADPDRFIDMFHRLNSLPGAEESGVWQTADGRFISVISRPQEIGGEIDGRVWTFRDVTAEKKAEESLKQSEVRFRELFEYSPVAYQSIAPDGTIIDVNPVWCELLQYSAEEAVGRMSFKDVWDSRFHNRFGTRFESFKAAGRIENTELELIKKDGTPITVILTGRIQKGANGEVVRSHCILLDITSRRAMEREIHRTREWLQTVLDNIDATIVVKDADQRIVLTNSRYESLTGLKRQDVIGRTELEISGRPQSRANTATDEQVMKSGEPVVYEESVVDERGRRRHFLVAKVPLSDSSGRCFALITQGTDITRLKKMESEVISGRANLNTLIENTRDAIWSVDRQYRAIIMNGVAQAGFSRLCGMPVKPGTSLVEAIPDHMRSYWKRQIDGTFSGQTFSSETYLGEKPDQECLEITFNPIRTNEGIVGAACYARNITAQKAAERELVEARDQAEAASRAKSTFLANISHEIRTPMNAIIGMTHLVLESRLGQKQRDYLQKIESASRALLGIIDDILDFSMIESENVRLEPRDFSPEEIVGAVIDVNTIGADSKHLEIHVDIDNAMPQRVSGDPGRLRQILDNLVANAIKFTADGDVVLKASVQSQTEDTVVLRFDVADTGIGMTEQQIQNVFKPFSQADNSSTREFGGAGLGLAICRQLCTMMGGEINVSSAPGSGSLFSVALPFRRPSDSESDGGAARHPDLKDHRALIIDDNPTALEVSRGILESMGIDTVVTNSPAGARIEMDNAASDPFDFIISDWIPGDFDSSDLVRYSRQSFSAAPATILLVPGPAYDENVQARTAGLFSAVLFKPVMPATWDETMARLASPDRDTGGAQKDLNAYDFTGSSILLVEDNRINQQVAVELLHRIGASVTIAENGAEAVRLASSNTFDAILMDIQMPVMDGIEATEAIRAFEDHSKRAVPIVAMTAHATDRDEKASLAAGMNAHITKPIEPDILYRTLSRWLKRSAHEMSEIMTEEWRETPPPADDSDDMSVPGLDVQKGLGYVGGNMALYKRLLRKFVEDYTGKDGCLEHVNLTNSPQDAYRFVHSIKGLAGTLGATALQEASAALESAIHAGDYFQEGLILAFRNRMNTLFSALRSRADLFDAAGDQRKPDYPSIEGSPSELLEKLVESVRRRQPRQSAQYMAALLAACHDENMKIPLSRAHEEIRKYRFDNALDIIQGLRVQRNPSGD